MLRVREETGEEANAVRERPSIAANLIDPKCMSTKVLNEGLPPMLASQALVTAGA